jgi:hypothetical protein
VGNVTSSRSAATIAVFILTTDSSRRIFESALEWVRRSFKLRVYEYVLMPEHVHLPLSEPQGDIDGSGSAPLKPKDGLNGPPAGHFAIYQEKSKLASPRD